MVVYPLPLELVIEIINAWSETVRRAAEITTEPTPLATLAEPFDLPLSPIEPTELAAWAERFHGVFVAASSTGRREALNAAIASIEPLPVITDDGPAWRVHAGADTVPAQMALTLAEYARTDPELERLGVCAAHRCLDAYADTSQAQTRRYCSLTCQNRAKTAARRARMS